MRNKLVNEIKKSLSTKYDLELANRIAKTFLEEFDLLVRENKTDPKALKKHTELRIFPAIAIYKAMQKNGITKDEAYQFIYDILIDEAKLKAKSMTSVCKTGIGLRIMPTMWKIVAKQDYGEKATFKQKFYKTDSYEARFDMLECPYHRICNKYNTAELTKIFCKTDDVGIEGVHERLLWKRTKTLGNGDDLCDFDVVLERKKHE